MVPPSRFAPHLLIIIEQSLISTKMKGHFLLIKNVYGYLKKAFVFCALKYMITLPPLNAADGATR